MQGKKHKQKKQNYGWIFSKCELQIESNDTISFICPSDRYPNIVQNKLSEIRVFMQGRGQLFTKKEEEKNESIIIPI